jgi:hypothetical protein
VNYPFHQLFCVSSAERAPDSLREKERKGKEEKNPKTKQLAWRRMKNLHLDFY